MSHVLIENRGVFNCSLQRAFESPILGDATRFLSGYRLQPGVVGFEDDSTWGHAAGVRYPITLGNLFLPRGRLLTDRIVERSEGIRWRWEIFDFRGSVRHLIQRAEACWEVSGHESNRVSVVYSYRYYPSRSVLYPALVLFAKLQLEGMHRKAFREIQAFAESDAPLTYPGMSLGSQFEVSVATSLSRNLV
jgi:hypothetical protein